MDPISAAAVGGASKVLGGLATPDANSTPRQDLTKASDQAAFKNGDVTAGQNTTIEGVVESLETIAKLYMNASPEMKVKYLKDLQDLVKLAVEKNVSLREAKQKGKLNLFENREQGYQKAQYDAQTQAYNEQLSTRKQGSSGVISMTSLKGTIASIAFMLNDVLHGALGNMPVMQKWKEEAESYKLKTEDIKKPTRVDLNFAEQPDALISNAEVQSEVDRVVTVMKQSAAIKTAESLGKEVIPTVKNPSPILSNENIGTKAKFVDTAADATTPKPAGAASAAMFGGAETLPKSNATVADIETTKAIKKAQVSSSGIGAAKMFADPELAIK